MDAVVHQEHIKPSRTWEQTIRFTADNKPTKRNITFALLTGLDFTVCGIIMTKPGHCNNKHGVAERSV